MRAQAAEPIAGLWRAVGWDVQAAEKHELQTGDVCRQKLRAGLQHCSEEALPRRGLWY